MRIGPKGLATAGVFTLGLAAGFVLAKGGFPTDASMFKDRKPAEAAATLLDTATKQAGDGTWERLGVARVYYLAGQKDRAQPLIDAVVNGKKFEEGDAMRLARIYLEAKEWDKAKAMYERAIQLDPKDGENIAEYGAELNLHGDRAKAEEQFEQAVKLKPEKLWVTLDVAGSYIGVHPQR